MLLLAADRFQFHNTFCNKIMKNQYNYARLVVHIFPLTLRSGRINYSHCLPHKSGRHMFGTMFSTCSLSIQGYLSQSPNVLGIMSNLRQQF